MGHHLSGLIGRTEILVRIAAAHNLEHRAELDCGMSFLPLDDENLDALLGFKPQQYTEEFRYISPMLLDFLASQSVVGDIAYIETEYFGGAGGQGAVLAQEGRISFGPEWVEDGTGPINDVLGKLGVQRTGTAHDRFDAVGLRHWRSNDDFRPETED